MVLYLATPLAMPATPIPKTLGTSWRPSFIPTSVPARSGMREGLALAIVGENREMQLRVHQTNVFCKHRTEFGLDAPSVQLLITTSTGKFSLNAEN